MNIAHKLSEVEKQRILVKVNEFFALGESGHRETRRRMEKNFRYVNGEQWDSATRKWNEARGKMCAQIPLIRPQTNFLTGQVVQNPKDLTMIPNNGGMKVLADLKSALMKHAMSSESAKYEIVHWAQSGFEVNSGYLLVQVNYDRDPLFGDLEIRQLDPFDCIPDPSSKTYDPNSIGDGAKFFFWNPWVDNDTLEMKYPEEYPMINSTQSGLGMRAFARSIMANLGIKRNPRGMTSAGDVANEDYTDLKTRIRHCWWIEPKKIWYMYDIRNAEDEDPIIITEEGDELTEARKAVKKWGENVFQLKEVVVPVMNHTIFKDHVMLEHHVDENNMLESGCTMFPTIPFHPYHASGHVSTVTDDLIGIQDFVNYTRSATFNLLKKQAGGGWIIGSDDDGTQVTWLENHGSRDNLVIALDKMGGSAKKIDPPRMSTSFEHMAETGKVEMREVTGIRTDNPEKDNKDLSGRAIALKQASAETGVSLQHMNLDYSLQLMGNLLSTLISSTRVYSMREITMVIEEKRLLDPQLLQEARAIVAQSLGIQIPEPVDFDPNRIMQMEQQEAHAVTQSLEALAKKRQQVIDMIDEQAKPMAIAALVDAMRNPAKGRYFASVSTSASAPSARFKAFAEMLDLSKALQESSGVALPAKYIVRASDAPDKEEILEDLGAVA